MNSKQTEQDYVPYGPEWEKEMSKFPKAQLVKMLGKAYQEKKELKQSLPAAKPVSGAYVSGKTSWPNKRGSFIIRYQDGRIDNYFIDQPNDVAKETWFKTANGWLFEWWDENAIAEVPAKPVSESPSDSEVDAVEFAEWIRDEDYVQSNRNGDKWYQKPFEEDSKFYTTSELYHLFKSKIV